MPADAAVLNADLATVLRADEATRVGARADLAVLSVDLPTLLRGDEALASVRSELTLVDGQEVHRS